MAEIPEHLRELVVECVYWSAERVFAVALAEEAEFLVLSGDVLQPEQTGPRGPLFLAEQFERLAERNIPVYWAGGRVDPPEAWPTCVKLPKNVHVFPTRRLERFLHQRDGQPVASIVGTSWQQGQAVPWTDFAIAPEGLFTVAVVHGEAEADVLRSRGIDYWALGGDHARQTLYSDLQAAHYPGSPQGREPDQLGPHGCTLVQVDVERHVRTNFVAADVLRWHNERIVVEPGHDAQGPPVAIERSDRLAQAIQSGRRPVRVVDDRRRGLLGDALAARKPGRNAAGDHADRTWFRIAGRVERRLERRAAGRAASLLVRAADDPRRFPSASCVSTRAMPRGRFRWKPIFRSRIARARWRRSR